jgi:hypothetical protein
VIDVAGAALSTVQLRGMFPKARDWAIATPFMNHNFHRLIRWLTPLFFLVLLATRPPAKSAAA